MPARATDGPVRGFAVRDRAIAILRRVQGGAHADDLLDRAAGEFDDARDSALLRECVLGTLRHRARLDFALQPVSRRPLAELDPVVLDALRLGAFQMFLLDRVPASAAVDTAVEVVSRRAGPGPAAFTNAVLRALARGRETRGAAPAGLPDPPDPATRHSHPAWLVERLAAELPPEELEPALAAGNEPALIGIRSNEVWESWIEAPPERPLSWGTPSPWAPAAWRTATIGEELLADLKSGRVYVQDEAAMLVSFLCFPRPSGVGIPIVLDLCAAPGGKALTALAWGCRIVAADRDPRRMPRLKDNLTRATEYLCAPPPPMPKLARRPEYLVADAEFPPFREASADLVILDAPCSGTGVIRRHPEIRWRLAPEAIARHSARQRRLIASAGALVRPGGVLVYSVCSVLREEGEEVIASLLEDRAGEFEIDDPRPLLPERAAELVSPEGIFRTWPHRHGLDGHVAARLVRRGSAPG